MINKFLARSKNPERGWDPVSEEHAEHYSKYEWQHANEHLLDILEERVGGFKGKRILDLGGGPGQYSIAFARRGGSVTWCDVSQRYKKIAQAKAIQYQVSNKVDFYISYMDDVERLLKRETFDFVFNRVCWYYGFDDKSFANVIYRMAASGGFVYIDTPNADTEWETLSASGKFRTWLNSALSIKIGHPYPPRGRIARSFLDQPIKQIHVDYSHMFNDRVFFEKA